MSFPKLSKLTLEKPVNKGFTLGRLPSGRVALIRGALPQEKVIVELTERSGVLQGIVVEVVTAHEDRIEAPMHPGLDYGFINYERQLKLKQEVVLDTLKHSLKRKVIVPQLKPAPSTWHYRHTVQAATVQGGLGYRKLQSHEVVKLSGDPTAHESINHFWQECSKLSQKGIHEVVFRCNDDGNVLICLLARASAKNYLNLAHNILKAGVMGVSYSHFSSRRHFLHKPQRLAGIRNIKQHFGKFLVTINSLSFSQPNPKAASSLFKELSNWVKNFDLGGEFALDLYAGSGIIAFHLCEHFAQVTALEVDASSIARGQKDAKDLELDNLRFVRADAKKVGTLPKAELITVNPPRAGLAKPVRQAIIASSAKNLIYISCDIATWARDVAHLEAEGFKLLKMQPYDFYPHTHHIEMLSLLSRKDV